MRRGRGRKHQGGSCLLGSQLTQHSKQLSTGFRVRPETFTPLKVVATALGGQPNFVQRFLQVDHNLTPVGKRQRDHAANALIVQVRIGLVIQGIARNFYGFQRRFGMVQVVKVGHYNFRMLKWLKILEAMPHADPKPSLVVHLRAEQQVNETPHRDTVPHKPCPRDFPWMLVGLMASTSLISGCGQKGPLYIPAPATATTATSVSPRQPSTPAPVVTAPLEGHGLVHR